MNDMNIFIILGLLFLVILVIVFAPHFVRTVLFGRYEAVTYECNVVAFLVSYFFLVKYNSFWPIIVFLILLVASGVAQFYFYMKLQKTVLKIFSKKKKKEERNERNDRFLDMIKIMVCCTIVPSFSRFIEESNPFNNPGNFIGLIKTYMKRKRFHKKKYLIRDVSADMINSIGYGKATPKKGSDVNDFNFVEIKTYEPEEFALDKKNEIAGLVAFDGTGFGAIAILTVFLLLFLKDNAGNAAWSVINRSTWPFGIIFLIFPIIIWFFRYIAFANREYIQWEYISSFSLFMWFTFVFKWLTSGFDLSHMIIAVISTAIYLIALIMISINEKKRTKGFTEMLDDKIKLLKRHTKDEYVKSIVDSPKGDAKDKSEYVSEVNRVKLRYLENIRQITPSMISSGRIPVKMGDKEKKKFEEFSLDEDIEADEKKSGNTIRFFKNIMFYKKYMPELLSRTSAAIDKDGTNKINEEKIGKTIKILNILSIALAVLNGLVVFYGFAAGIVF